MPKSDAMVIAVAGGTASGKTTLVSQVSSVLDGRVAVLSQDSYYKDCPPGGFVRHNFDIPEAINFAELAEDLVNLKSGQAVDCPRYCYQKHRRLEGTAHIRPKPVIIVEGILVLAMAEVRALADLCVFVDHPAELRLARRLRRDTAQRGHHPEGIIQQYVDSVAPAFESYVEPSRQHADVIVRGSEQSFSRLMRVIGNIRRVGMR